MLPLRTDPLAAPLLLKIGAGLALALAASLYGNYHQWSSAIQERAVRAFEVSELTAKAEALAAQNALEYTRGFNDAAAQEGQRIDQRMAEIADQQERLAADYWRRLRSIPPMPVGCAPGEQRIDAFNNWEP